MIQRQETPFGRRIAGFITPSGEDAGDGGQLGKVVGVVPFGELGFRGGIDIHRRDQQGPGIGRGAELAGDKLPALIAHDAAAHAGDPLGPHRLVGAADLVVVRR